MSREINFIVIHCSASPNGKAVTPGDIDGWHKARGFKRKPEWLAKQQAWLKHFGYHYVITTDGILTNGRHLDEIGAHVQGSNAKAIGICLVGMDKFTEAQWRTLAGLVRTLESRYPKAEILGHRDFSPDQDGDGVIEPWEWIKSCPGFDVREWQLKGRAALPAHTLYSGASAS